MSAAEKIHDLIIVGAGPAGYTAAIYAARGGVKPLLIRGQTPGGQLTITTDVENFPGFGNIQGPELMERMAKQALEAGTTFAEDHIVDVAFGQETHTLSSKTKTYQARSVIIATGAEAKWLGLESETTFRGFGVSACATCDGPLFRNKIIGVVGGGNTAAEEALFLSRFGSHVYLIHRRDEMRAEKVLQERLLANEKITPLWNKIVTQVHGQTTPFKRIESVTLEDTKDGTQSTQKLDGLFIAIGHKPNTDFLKGQLALDDEGYVKGIDTSMRTEFPGVFTAGDVKDKIYRQAVTAAGQGCMAALDALAYLR